MWPFKFLNEVLFDTDSGGAPGGAGGSDGGTPAPAGAEANAFDQLVQLMNDPAPAPVQGGGQDTTPAAADQIQRSGSVPQSSPAATDPMQQLGSRPLTRVVPGQPAQAPAAQPGQPPIPVDPKDEMLRQLQTTVANLEGRIQAFSQPRQPEPQSQPQQQPARRYNFGAPAQVMEALRSEDPAVATQTLFTMLSDLAENVHNTILHEVQQNLAPHLLRTAATQADTTANTRAVEQDFYGAHKDLDQPHLRPLVRSVAMNYLQELGTNFKNYSPEFRDTVAQRTRELIYRTAGVATNFRPGPDQVAGRGNPAQLSPQGTRPSSGVQPNGAALDHNSPAAILATLGL